MLRGATSFVRTGMSMYVNYALKCLYCDDLLYFSFIPLVDPKSCTAQELLLLFLA